MPFSDAFLFSLKKADNKTLSTMKFDHASEDLQLIWNTFLDFEAFTREADGDLNYFIEEWKEKMVRVQSVGCQYSELLLGLKLLEKVNLSNDSIISIISKLGSSHFNSDSFLVQVVTNLQAESGFGGSTVDDTEKNNQTEAFGSNQEISVELDIKSNLISCPHCPDKFFDAESLSKHFQDFHPNENEEKVLISKKDLKPDPDLLKYSNCEKNVYPKEDLEKHQKSNDSDLTLESDVQVWVGSPERSAENSKDDPLMSDEIKIEINSVIGLKSDIHNVQAENESSDQMMTNSSDKFKFVAKTGISNYKQLHMNNVFKCSICQKEFNLARYLRAHLKTHKETKDFICSYCGKAFTNSSSLRKHIKIVCRNDICEICGQQVAHAQKDKHMRKHFHDPFKCDICGKEFQKKSKLNNHMDNHRTTKDFICFYCGKRFQNRNNLGSHIIKQHRKLKIKEGEAQNEVVTESSQISGTTNGQIKTLDKIEGIQKKNSDSTPTDDNLSLAPANKAPCKICGKFVAKTGMSKHKKLHMNNVFKCSICQKEFTSARYVKRHLETHKETNDHICPYCSKSFKTSSSLRKHIKIVCRNDICEICGQQVAHAQKDKHMRKHFRDPFKCDICGKEFQEKCRLNYHMDNHRKTKDFMCSHCGLRFQNRKYLGSHIINQHRKKKIKEGEAQNEIVTESSQISIYPNNYKCSICQKQFKFRSYLKVHKETHNTTNEYICSFCGKKYKTKRTLDEHINLHTKVQPLPCNFCEKIFYCHGARRFHIRAHHTGEKPYKCDICDERFYISSRKVQHMRKHTGEKPFSCDACGKNFRLAWSLKKHVRTVHKEVKSRDI